MVIHPDDDVARSIRNEQMADGAPSPAEAREEARRHLAAEGCEVCDEDDPDRLGWIMPFVPSCPAWQAPPGDPERVLCDEHRRSPRAFWWAYTVKRARGHDADAIAVYECDSVSFATMPEFPEPWRGPGVAGWDDVPPQGRPTPEVPIRCEGCEARLKEVRYLGGEER